MPASRLKRSVISARTRSLARVGGPPNCLLQVYRYSSNAKLCSLWLPKYVVFVPWTLLLLLLLLCTQLYLPFCAPEVGLLLVAAVLLWHVVWISKDAVRCHRDIVVVTYHTYVVRAS